MEIKSKSNAVTFQDNLKVTLVVGQLFSLLPVFGITDKNVLNVKYIRKSWKSFYAVLSICCQLFMTAMCSYNVYLFTNLGTASSIVFYGTCSITMAIFINIAKSWPKLVWYIAQVEDLDPSFDGKLPKKCICTCAIVLFLALSEHMLSLLSEIYGANACLSPPIDSYEEFLKHFYGWIFIIVPYHPLLGVLFQIQATFTWNFSDLFVICMSYYLTSRLQLVNEKLRVAQGKPLPESFWRSIREEYGRATQLVRKVDKVISGIVFISFANNLFYICLQLFFTLENGVRGENKCINHPSSGPMTGYITGVYFSYSLIYLISRSVAVSLIASQVHTASTFPASALYDVPTQSYCNEILLWSVVVSFGIYIWHMGYVTEPGLSGDMNGESGIRVVQRFLSQVNGDKVALSGLQFFSVTRGLLLTVAGTIVTYELVMFQINVPTAQAQQDQISSITTTMIPQVLNFTGT